MPLDPATLAALITGGSQVASAVLGSTGAQEANYTNYLNYLEQQRANQARELQAQDALRQAQAAQVTPSGSRVYFDPVTNEWRTDMSDIDRALLGAEQAAVAQRLGPDEYRYARGQEQNFANQLDADRVADAILREVGDRTPITADQIYGDQLVKGYADMAGSQDRILNSIMGGMRATGTDQSKMLSQAMQDRWRQLPSLRPSKTQARAQALDLGQNLRGSRLNQYNVAAGRAAAPGQGVTPTGLSSSLSNLAGQGQQRGTYAGLMGLNAIQPSTLGQMQVDNTLPLQIGAIGDAAGGLIEALGKKKQPQGPPLGYGTMYSAGTGSGLFNAPNVEDMKDRVRVRNDG